VNPAKTSEPIEMPFGLWTRVGLKEPTYHIATVQFWGETSGFWLGVPKYPMYFHIRPYHRRTWTVQSYPPGGANVLSSSKACLGLSESISQTASRLVDRFCAAHGRKSLYLGLLFFQNVAWVVWGSRDPPDSLLAMGYG